jgi:type IV secretion system protein VirD4
MDFGLLSTAVKFIIKFIKLFVKSVIFFGLYWIIIFLSPFLLIEKISGKSIQSGSVLNVISYPFLLMGFAFAILTTIQSILRMIKKDRSISIFKLIFNKFIGIQKKKGYEAKLNLVTTENIRGFVFGKRNNKYVVKDKNDKGYDCDGHILVIGAPGSGKSSCLAIPTLMSWKERVFCIDIKGELYEKTKKVRGEEQIKVFNPSEDSAYGYDPYYVLKDTDDINESVKEIAQAIIPLPPNSGDQAFWIESAQDYLTGSIIHFYSFNMNFAETCIEIKKKPCKELVAEIMSSGNNEAIIQMSAFSGMDDKTLSGIFAEVSRNITPFATNKKLIKALGNTEHCITPQDLEDGYDVFLCIEEHKLGQWKTLVTMMVNQFTKFFEKRKNDNPIPILFLLDEFGRLGRIESVLSGLATLRSKGIQIALLIQSKAQLDVIYGEKQAVNIVDNCTYKVFLHVGEPDMQKWCSNLFGTYEKLKISSNYNTDTVGIGKGMGTSSSYEEKPIFKSDLFGHLQETDELICMFPTGYAKLKKTSCYKDKAFQIIN